MEPPGDVALLDESERESERESEEEGPGRRAQPRRGGGGGAALPVP